MSILVTASAELLGYDKRYCWLRLPKPKSRPGRAFVILTLPRKVLKRGFARAEVVKIEYPEDSLSFDGTHFTADVEMISVERYKKRDLEGPGTGLDSQGTG